MSGDREQKKDLQGWAMIAATRQKTLNTGLKKLHDIIPAEYRSINFEHTMDSPLGPINLTLKDAALGVIQVKAVLDGQKRTNVHIPFEGGQFLVNDTSYDLTGAWLEVDISLIAFKAVIHSEDGENYDVHIDVNDEFAAFEAKGCIDDFTAEFLAVIMKVAMNSLAGKSYYIYSFTVGKDFKYKSLIPSEVQTTFVYNETENDKSVFCAVMATKDVPAPTAANRYALTESEVISDEDDLVINVGNPIFIDLLKNNLKSSDLLGDATWNVVGDSPASLQLSEKVSNIKDGADLTSCTITAKEGRIYLELGLKKVVSPGITLTLTGKQKLKPVWDEAKGVLKLEQDGDLCWNHTVKQSIWLTILEIFPGMVGYITKIIIWIIKGIVEDSLPDLNDVLGSAFDLFELPIALPKVVVSLGVKINTFSINYYGSIRFGVKFEAVE